jgi:hypothetical protein
MWAKGTLTTTAGDIDIRASDSTIKLDGDVSAAQDLLLRSDAVAGVMLAAGQDVITAGGVTLTGEGALTVQADRDITLGGAAETAGDMTLIADNDEDGLGDMHALSTLTTTSSDMLITGQNITVDGAVDSSGDIQMMAAADITLHDAVTAAGDMTLTADNGDGDGLGDMTANGTLTAGGNIEVSAGDDTIKLLYNDADPAVAEVDAGGDIILSSNTEAVDGVTLRAGDNVFLAADKTLKGLGDLTVEAAYDIILGGYDSSNGWAGGSAGDVEAGGDIILTAGADIYALGDLTAGGDIELYSSGYDTTYLGGDVTALVNVLLNTNTMFTGSSDQHVNAQTGTLTANGWLHKSYGEGRDGSLYLHAAGDISLEDDVAADHGGVSIISDNSKIYTEDGVNNDTLNVIIAGYSSQADDLGVPLPGEPDEKAAIVLISKQDLKLGPDGELRAFGAYDGEVNDRSGVNFLDVSATIGDVLRNEGEPFDVAIYIASTAGDVDVSCPVVILQGDPYGEEHVPAGTMVITAWDSITFDAGAEPGQTPFEDSLAEGMVGSRLEVASRVCEWLPEAMGRLPFADEAETYSLLWYGQPGLYVLRGAGLGNPEIIDGRAAWVLENPPTPPEPPLTVTEAAPLAQAPMPTAEQTGFALGGCPALMQWLASEMGISAERIEVYVATAFALSTDIQPCEACARLKDAATVLADEEAGRVVALIRTVNEFVTAGGPPSEEQVGGIASALALHIGDGTRYAAAGEWLDALTEYMRILTSEFGLEPARSVALAMGKYGTALTEPGNERALAYVQVRLGLTGG